MHHSIRFRPILHSASVMTQGRVQYSKLAHLPCAQQNQYPPGNFLIVHRQRLIRKFILCGFG